jgi:hypothetical protein
MNISIYPKLIYGFNAIQSESQMGCLGVFVGLTTNVQIYM